MSELCLHIIIGLHQSKSDLPPSLRVHTFPPSTAALFNHLCFLFFLPLFDCGNIYVYAFIFFGAEKKRKEAEKETKRIAKEVTAAKEAAIKAEKRAIRERERAAKDAAKEKERQIRGKERNEKAMAKALAKAEAKVRAHAKLNYFPPFF